MQTWSPCDVTKAPTDEVSAMGYSMRTLDYRYTVWLPVDRASFVPMFSVPHFAEALYDHRGALSGDIIGHRELDNVAGASLFFRGVAAKFYKTLIAFLRDNVLYSQNMMNRQNMKSIRNSLVDEIKRMKFRADSLGTVDVVDEEEGAESRDKEKRAGDAVAAAAATGMRSEMTRLRRAKTERREARNISHQTNFLFIMFDDLRPELSIYGESRTHDTSQPYISVAPCLPVCPTFLLLIISKTLLP